MILDRQFDLSALARAKGKTGRIEFRPIAIRLAFEESLYREFLKLIRAYEKAKPEILQTAAMEKAALTRDAWGLSDIVAALRGSMAQVVSFSRRPMQSLFEGEARRHDETWMQQVNRVIGVDLEAVVRSDDIKPRIDLAVQKNVALIQGLSDEIAKRIESQVIDLVSRGASNKEIAKTLGEIGGFAKGRAKLIAVDQAGSFNSALNQMRQEQAGVTRYTWSTVRDNRVRPEHRAREGKVYRWDTPPAGGAPGQAVRCRCVARAILDLDEAKYRRAERNRARQQGTAAVAAALGL